MKKIELSIIIVNYKNYNDTIDCIRSVYNQLPNKFKTSVIVVDNYSNNKSVENILNSFNDLEPQILNGTNRIKLSKLNLIINERNLGFGGGNNVAFKYINSGYVLLLNPDIVLPNDFLKSLISLKKNHLYGFPTYDFYKKNNLLFLGGFNINVFFGNVYPNLYENQIPDYINGSGFLSHYLFFKENKFNLDYFLYWEETDLCRKIDKSKFKILYDSKMYDKKSTTIGRGFISEYYYQRNKLYYFYFQSKILAYYYFIIGIFFLAKRLLTFRFSLAYGLIIGYKDFLIGKKGNIKSR